MAKEVTIFGEPCKILSLRDYIEKHEQPGNIRAAMRLSHAKRAWWWQAERLARRLDALRMPFRGKVLSLNSENDSTAHPTITPEGPQT